MIGNRKLILGILTVVGYTALLWHHPSLDPQGLGVGFMTMLAPIMGANAVEHWQKKQ